LRIVVGCDVALVQVSDYETLGRSILPGYMEDGFILVEQGDNAGAPRIVVLGGDVHQLGVDNPGYLFDNPAQPVRVVFLVDIFQVFQLRLGC